MPQPGQIASLEQDVDSRRRDWLLAGPYRGFRVDGHALLSENRDRIAADRASLARSLLPLTPAACR